MSEKKENPLSDEFVLRTFDTEPNVPTFHAHDTASMKESITKAIAAGGGKVMLAAGEYESLPYVPPEVVLKGPEGPQSAEDIRTNPETCRHKVLGARLDKLDIPVVVCISCDSVIPNEFLEDKHYEYAIDANVWVYHGPCDC